MAKSTGSEEHPLDVLRAAVEADPIATSEVQAALGKVALLLTEIRGGKDPIPAEVLSRRAARLALVAAEKTGGEESEQFSDQALVVARLGSTGKIPDMPALFELLETTLPKDEPDAQPVPPEAGP